MGFFERSFKPKIITREDSSWILERPFLHVSVLSWAYNYPKGSILNSRGKNHNFDSSIVKKFHQVHLEKLVQLFPGSGICSRGSLSSLHAGVRPPKPSATSRIVLYSSSQNAAAPQVFSNRVSLTNFSNLRRVSRNRFPETCWSSVGVLEKRIHFLWSRFRQRSLCRFQLF